MRVLFVYKKEGDFFSWIDERYEINGVDLFYGICIRGNSIKNLLVFLVCDSFKKLRKLRYLKRKKIVYLNAVTENVVKISTKMDVKARYPYEFAVRLSCINKKQIRN